ncbi:hypothetical protein [uncultured Bacteroides sp.]|uniref:hypothetical protein n=1 Tax=uncultured Bacteroides sp. TaxID=162156 RepID=UPI0025E82D3B|nr:hypothetical protein [uncultured Bacteroides sp.]
MRKVIRTGILLSALLLGLGGCIPDDLDDCTEPDGKKDGVDIVVDMDPVIDPGDQETEMP